MKFPCKLPLQCLVWVKTSPGGPETALPVYPEQQTSSGKPGWFVLMQFAQKKKPPECLSVAVTALEEQPHQYFVANDLPE
jgi:hypothetical protein